MQEYEFSLRQEKCQFFLISVVYLGLTFDGDGHHLDSENVQSIHQMPRPTDVGTLRSFLELVSYYNAFLPSLHNKQAPLNRLPGQNVPWCSSAECERTFLKLKRLLTSDLLLTHHDPQKPIIFAADASRYGVDAVISHRFPDGSEKAVIPASQTMTAAERNYSQIEKGDIALVFAQLAAISNRMKRLLLQLSLSKMISDTKCQALYAEFHLQPMTFTAQPITTRCFDRSSHSSMHSGRRRSMETWNSCINDVHNSTSSIDVSCLPADLS